MIEIYRNISNGDKAEILQTPYPPEMNAVITLLELSVNTFDSTPGREKVNGLIHSLQTATRAVVSNAPRSEIVMAVLHDSMRVLSPENHEGVIAALMRDRLPFDHIQALAHHAEFQSDIVHDRDDTHKYKGEEWYAIAKRLAKWDGDSFDPTYPTLPLEYFLPLIYQECYAQS